MGLPDHKHVVVDRVCLTEAALLRREEALAVAAFSQACGDELEKYFSGVYHEGDTLVVSILRRVLILEQYRGGGVVLPLWQLSCLPHNDDFVKSPEDVLVFIEE